MVELKTPVTGYPDLEIKIAYGLTRVAVETYGTSAVTLTPLGGHYKIEVAGDIERLNNTLNLLCKRILSSPRIPSEIPGIVSRTANDLMVRENDVIDLSRYTSVVYSTNRWDSTGACRHADRQRVSNVLGFTSMVNTGVLCSRDRLDVVTWRGQTRRPTEPVELCKTCAALALIGMRFSCFFLRLGDSDVVVTPIPEGQISGHELERLYALQGMSRGIWMPKDVSMRLIPLIFFSKVPSSAEILKEFDLIIAVLKKGQAYRVDGLFYVDVMNYADFLSYSPFNVSTIDTLVKCLIRDEKDRALFELDTVLNTRNPINTTIFSRLYAKDTTRNGANLLYPDTAKYLLKEVAMIDEDIIKNPSINALAKTFRYFIRERNYGYIDNIRNARRESRDFEETIAKMLREAELRRVQQEQERQAGREVKNWVYIPKTEEIQEVFSLAQRDFESTKIALSILSFTFPTRGEEKSE